jgi:hypothetical protein
LARSYHSLILGLQGFADQAILGVECNLVAARASDHPVIAAWPFICRRLLLE